MKNRIAFARALRREPTPAEQASWALLYPWREAGLHWRRQAPIGPFVVDFCCKRLKLIVKIDGDSHYFAEGQARDEARTAFLERQGYWVVRSECLVLAGITSSRLSIKANRAFSVA